MANATIGDIDLDVVRARRAPGDVHRFERFVGGISAKGFHSHGKSF
jgi:hypothetical protein